MMNFKISCGLLKVDIVIIFDVLKFILISYFNLFLKYNMSIICFVMSNVLISSDDWFFDLFVTDKISRTPLSSSIRKMKIKSKKKTMRIKIRRKTMSAKMSLKNRNPNWPEKTKILV